MGKQRFLDALAASLTAQEQIQLFEAAGAAFAEAPAELYTIALAHVAEACGTTQPQLLGKAVALLERAAVAAPPLNLPESGALRTEERRALEVRRAAGRLASSSRAGRGACLSLRAQKHMPVPANCAAAPALLPAGPQPARCGHGSVSAAAG